MGTLNAAPIGIALTHEHIKHITMKFLDKHNFCLAQVKRSCVHFVTEQEKIIPFETYNLFYRPGIKNV